MLTNRIVGGSSGYAIAAAPTVYAVPVISSPNDIDLQCCNHIKNGLKGQAILQNTLSMLYLRCVRPLQHLLKSDFF